jgi:hypothetical protein
MMTSFSGYWLPRAGEQLLQSIPGRSDTRQAHSRGRYPEISSVWSFPRSNSTTQGFMGRSVVTTLSGRTASSGGRPASGSSDRQDRQIRSLVLRVDPVRSRRIWPAHVGRLVDPDGSRPVPSDRPDDQTDDQAVRHGALDHQTIATTWSEHQMFHLATLTDRRDSEQRAPDHTARAHRLA